MLATIKQLKALEARVKDLEAKQAEVIIGEVYADELYFASHNNGVQILLTNATKTKRHARFVPFAASDIQDSLEDKIKIRGCWFDNKDIIMYDAIYNKRRDIIKKRYSIDG